MSIKGILLDIDNTLYNYKNSHDFAFHSVINFAKEFMCVDEDVFIKAYGIARESINQDLAETASSHNRLLYFQRTCENLCINPLIWGLKLYDVYWDAFLDSIQLSDGVMEFLEQSSKKYKICFLTDLTAHIQYRKIEKLNLARFVSSIVTSEESGAEKPHPYMFMLAANKLNLPMSQVIMIGDNYDKDILGANRLGIKSIFINTGDTKIKLSCELITEVTMFKDVLRVL